MKILLLGFSKIKYMPYANFYLDNLDKAKHNIHLLYWNRDLKEEDTDQYQNYTLHEFKCYQEDQVSKVSKLKNFCKYRSYVLKLIKKEKFDFIIVLHTLPGVLIAKKLRKHYAGRYIFDYRDSTYEKFAPYKKIIANLVNYSYTTFVSSDGFRKFLPQSEKLYISHNILTDSLKHREEKAEKDVGSDKIRIAFWGFIRHEALNREIIKKIAKDKRFELHYYGREQTTALNLKKYAQEIGAENVFFHGEYKPEDRYDFVKNTDIIHNVYYDDNMMLAMGNKYYDGIIFYLPQICMNGSFMGESVEKNGIGWQVNPYDEDFLEKIYVNYQNLHKDIFYNRCDGRLNEVIKEYHDGVAIIKEI